MKFFRVLAQTKQQHSSGTFTLTLTQHSHSHTALSSVEPILTDGELHPHRRRPTVDTTEPNRSAAADPLYSTPQIEPIGLPSFHLKNPVVKRILQEVKEMQSNPSGDFMSLPLEFDMKFSKEFFVGWPNGNTAIWKVKIIAALDRNNQSMAAVDNQIMEQEAEVED